MKIQLFDAQGYWLKKEDGEVDQVVLPLGLMYLAAHARDAYPGELDFEIYNTVVDFDNDPLQIAECIKSGRPDIVGIRGMTKYQREFGIVAEAAKRHSDALVVGGGPYVSSDPDFGLKDHPIDVAVFGEGEVTFTELIGRHRREQSFESIAGLAYRPGDSADNGIRCNDARPYLTPDELDAMPFPAYDLVDNDKYATFLSYGYNKRRQGVVYTSRGCPYRCDFCHVLFGKKFRQRSPESLYREVSWLYDDYGIRDFYIVDDIFNLQKERAVEFFESLSSSPMGGNIRLYFVNGLRADRVDRKFIDAAVAAGAVWLAYAVETASPRLQKEIQKHLDIERVKRTIEYSAQKGVVVVYWGMLGIQTETIEEAQATVDLLNSMPGSVIPMLFSNTPYPGTDAWDKLKRRERELGEQLKFQSFSTFYHDFMGLIRRNPAYFDVIKSWSDTVNSLDSLRRATKSLMAIGHTAEDIEAAYQLLYRKLDREAVGELIAWAEDRLHEERDCVVSQSLMRSRTPSLK